MTGFLHFCPVFLSCFFLSKTTSSFLNRSCCYYQKFFVRKYMDVFHNNLHPEAARVLQQFWEESEAATGDILLRKGVLRNFAKFTGKHLCQSLFFNKVAGLRSTEHAWATASKEYWDFHFRPAVWYTNHTSNLSKYGVSEMSEGQLFTSQVTTSCSIKFTLPLLSL